MTLNRRTPELLAPAGDWTALRAACANGANAVYFGLDRFNARHRATNFTEAELPEVMAFLHHRNVRGFVALNTLIFSDELPDIAEYLQTIAANGVDAVIVQDLGLAMLIRRLVPKLEIHASTQMTLTESRGVKFAAGKLGVERVVLGRELSVSDIRRVWEETSVPIEVFVHGALCVAYSGQCLTSEALGGRSANRGQCAQACRLPYEMYVDGEHRELGDKAYLLSPQDLAGYAQVADMIEAGVVSFKIEGRLKGPEYVAAAATTYRAAIDAAINDSPFRITDRQLMDMEQTFSRGFTPGFLEGPNHQQLVRGRFPKNRGMRIGKVVGTTLKSVRIDLQAQGPIEDSVKPGDGLMFDIGKPQEKEPGGRVWRVEIRPGSRFADVSFDVESVDLSAIPVGCVVWKTDDPATRKRLEQTYARDSIVHRTPITIALAGHLGGSLTATATDPAGNSATATWAGPLQAATKQPTTVEAVREQLSRLGETPFELAAVESRAPANAMIPKSVLNDLRRQLAEQLQTRREEAVKVSVGDPDALANIRKEIAGRTVAATKPESFLTVQVHTIEQLKAVLPLKPTMVYADFEDVRRYREAVPLANEAGVPIGLATLRILKPGDEGFLKPILWAKPDAILVRNLGSIGYFREHAPQIPMIGDFSLNVANEITADVLMAEGLTRLVPSYDLNWDQLVALVKHSHAEWFEPVIHQHMPMFHMEHCVFAAFLSTGKDWRDCGRPCEEHAVDLRDRTGASFPVTPDAGCRNTVFNSVPQSGAEYVQRMQDIGLRRFRIDMVRETPEQAAALVETYKRVLSGAEDGRQTWRLLKAMNQLGVTRGTLNLL
ncbi:DUF3656 domain-containing U32 family peptidase [Zavarzinella formosa]|uniref:DUF3656 domain-containing U32 family peptidase n=1 Tax=Zavarzinella formosa TaxID=360055 RepID=UPI0002EFF579|nr:U32 family peptidase [Zavarzinella formosa]